MVAGGRELIDTLWNVNSQCHFHKTLLHRELIDTLWNVNEGRQKTFYFGNVN